MWDIFRKVFAPDGGMPPHIMEHGRGWGPIRISRKDQSIRSMKLPLEKYVGDLSAVVSLWGVLGGINAKQGGGASIGAAPTPRVVERGE